ncbi:MAG: hypothetical protein E7214_06630 [Clostridium sp.]|nr:hypothetical protein [Clostridium sp.]
MKKKIGLLLISLIFLVSTFNFTTKPINAATSSNNGNFDVSYLIQSSWGTGATVKITIKNKGKETVNGWELGFTFPGNQKISNAWNAKYTQKGQTVKLENEGFNGVITPGSSVEVGINISFNGENKVPTDFTVNSEKVNSKSPENPTKPEPTKPDPAKAKFHVFLLLGQSNMAGYPKAQAADKVKDNRILVLGYDNNPANGRVKDKWDVASAPLHDAWNDAVGPGDWFAKTLINKVSKGDTIGLVPCAISGEKIETFMKGGSKYNWIIQRAKLAQAKGGVIDGIIFHQGESNCGNPAWPGMVNTLVEDLRKDLKIGNVPFIAGELLRTGNCSSHNRLVNQLPSVIKNCYVVSSEGLTKDPSDTWNLHFSHDSQVTLGKRYAEKMIKALNW